MRFDTGVLASAGGWLSRAASARLAGAGVIFSMLATIARSR
jgi:hypothetical protein